MRGARRSWSAGEKRRIVEESLRPGASVSVVARHHDLNANLLFTCNRRLSVTLRAC
jgi:transposase